MSSFKEWKELNGMGRNGSNYRSNEASVVRYYKGERFKINRISRNNSKRFDVRIFRNEPHYDFMKYYILMAYSASRKMNIKKEVFELMLLLYSEVPLTKNEMNSYFKLLPFKYNLKTALDSGLFAQSAPLEDYMDAPEVFYSLGTKAKIIIHRFYERLLKIKPDNINEIRHPFSRKTRTELDNHYKKHIQNMIDNDNDGFAYLKKAEEEKKQLLKEQQKEEQLNKNQFKTKKNDRV